MNQVDLFVIVVVGGCAVSGARRGVISAGGDIISLALGLVIGALAYPVGAAPMRWLLGVPPPIAGALGFIVVALATVLLAGWGFSLLAGRFDVAKGPSRVGGAGFGAAFGVVLAAVLILASGILPGAAAPVSESALGSRIVGLVPRMHENMEGLGVPLPKLVHLPSDYMEEVAGPGGGLQFLRINFSRLDGATCIHCRSAVGFTGYQFSRGALMSPRFECPKCGRTSDGCQTFEGFHEIYRRCPVLLAGEGVQFDCGVWTNGWWTVPHGPCPVCGLEYVPGEEAIRSAAAGARGSGGATASRR